MGSKTQTVQQQQQYTPNPLIQSYGGTALQYGSAAAQQPFSNMPVQPVAGFSPDQLAAFDYTRGLQGGADPYFNAAAGLIYGNATPDVGKYYAAESAGILPQMENIFGQQRSANTADLVHAAGGVGAGRIAVGQGDLANRQALAAGQTLSQIYGQAAGQANAAAQLGQGAGYGLANIGAGKQTADLNALQALLTSGGMQQYLQQQQLNAPYSWQVQQFQYPFQTAQYLAGLTGGLAPGLGGTTSGQTTYPGPSLWSQLLGAGLAGGSLMGGMGQMGWKPFSARGGAVDGDDHYDLGGATALGDNPFKNPLVPDIPLHMGSGERPFNPPKPPQQQNPLGGLGGLGDAIKGYAQLAKPKQQPFSMGPPRFEELNEPGAVFGPNVNIEDIYGPDVNRAEGGVVNPFAPMEGYEEGGDVIELPPDEVPTPVDPAAIERWRSGVDSNPFSAGTEPPAQKGPADVLPQPIRRPGGDVMPLGVADRSALPTDLSAYTAPDRGGATPSGGPVSFGDAFEKYSHSPWAALTAAGLGIMAGQSPFALTNIGTGGLQGVKQMEQMRQDKIKEESLRRQEAQQRSLEQHQRAVEQHQRYMEGIAGQKQQFDIAKPQTIQTLLGPRNVIFDRDKKAFVDMDTNEPMMSPSGTPATSPAAAAPPSGDPDRPYKGVAPSLATMTKAQRADLNGQAFLDSVPKGVRNDLEAVANYEAPITIASKYGRQGMSQMQFLELVRQVNPLYDMTAYAGHAAAMKEFLSGGMQSPAGQIMYLRTAVGHAGDMSDALEDMRKNGAPLQEWAAEAAKKNIPFVSYLAQQVSNKAVQGTALGDAIARFKIASDLFSAETIRMYAGGQGALKDREELKAPFGLNLSYNELTGALHQATHMIGSRAQSLEERHKTAMDMPGLATYGTKKIEVEQPDKSRKVVDYKDYQGGFGVLNERTKSAMDKIEQRYRANNPRGPEISGTGTALPPPAEREINKVYTNAHGKKAKWTEHGWEPIP